ncbi:EAL domain-containing protein [Pseudohongiella sp.]|nr:EAL domain-containing protein [Pseudohongiella sp.]HDZ09876.1 EAL domain-containing protein [Pseudohongiella sp.]HEA61509.1 EAL domain-containing protein [Pseudohongiella sp.]
MKAKTEHGSKPAPESSAAADVAGSTPAMPELDTVEALQVEKLYRAGEVIMRQNEPGDCAYFVQSGLVEIVLQRPDGSEMEVGRRGPGTLIGEMAIVDDGPRSATVRALEDCRLLEISKADFSRAVKNANPIVGLVTKLILMRYRDILQRSENVREFAGVTTMLEQQERYHAEESRVLDAVRMANEFKVAVARQELFLEYQPFIEIDSGRIIGFEALMRWHHPVSGRMRPDLFIPMAEDTGLIIEATRWAFRESCKALKRMITQTGDSALFISVNFSAQDFDDPAFLDEMLFTLHDTGIHPSQIHLEITERLLLRQSEHVKKILLQCREHDMQIAIDDFGTGYSSLSYLHQYPVTTLKIDQSFVRNMTSDEGALGLVKSILSLSENMGLAIIAEGVETQQHVDMLKSLGCQVAQGFFFARPVSEHDAAGLLAAQPTTAP